MIFFLFWINNPNCLPQSIIIFLFIWLVSSWHQSMWAEWSVTMLDWAGACFLNCWSAASSPTPKSLHWHTPRVGSMPDPECICVSRVLEDPLENEMFHVHVQGVILQIKCYIISHPPTLFFVSCCPLQLNRHYKVLKKGNWETIQVYNSCSCYRWQ